MTTNARFDALTKSLRLPLVVAPMTGVSTLELTSAAITAGIAASFPLHNCGSTAEADRWLAHLAGLGTHERLGPVIPNLIVHTTNARLRDDLGVVISHDVPAVITSVGSPEAVVGPLRDAGILVLSDVASLRHVERAIKLGVDGLVLLSAGAGGQTGWANPLAFIRAVRDIWDGPVVLAGGVADGASLLAARVAGCDLAYMGTRFIATHESAASERYRAALVASSLDDIELTTEFTGLATSMVRTRQPVSHAAVDRYDATALPDLDGAAINADFFSAGHAVSGVTAALSAADLIAQIEAGYVAAARDTARWLAHDAAARTVATP